MNKKERSFGLKVKCIHFGMFDYSVSVVTGEYKYLQDYLRWKHDEPEYHLERHPCGNKGLTLITPGYAPIIWLPKISKKTAVVATVSHECLHVVQSLFDWAGIPMNRSTDEVAGHALGYLVKEIFKK